MTQWLFRAGLFGTLLTIGSFTQAVPLPSDKKGGETITDRKDFIPSRKHAAVPGKIIAALVHDAQPVLSTEGRSGPADQLVHWPERQ